MGKSEGSLVLAAEKFETYEPKCKNTCLTVQ